ncbi:MAG: GntR family transcriptional regulator [Deinococcales bacterium]
MMTATMIRATMMTATMMTATMMTATMMTATMIRATMTMATQLPLKEQAYQQLKKLILSEELPINGFLSERGLAEQLGMSKTPIRLAIERLEHEGFVRVSPQQGIVVTALSFEEILDYIEYRLALESFVVQAISGKLTQEQITSLEQHLAQQKALLAEEANATQHTAVILADRDFHSLLMHFKGNQQILQALGRQQDMIFRVAHRIYQRYPARREQSYLEHQELASPSSLATPNRL